MPSRKFDVVVVGSGPAGSVAALTLAQGGASVALVDKAAFPRDKACGDLLGPRAVALLEGLHLAPESLPVGDMLVVGPTGRHVRLRCTGGITYPGYALAQKRLDLDASLREAALGSGAHPIEAHVVASIGHGPLGTKVSLECSDGGLLEADFVIGADGATSRIAEGAGLVHRTRVQWGFAARTYLEAEVSLPTIVLWEPSRWSAVPGYGWIFPSPGGGSNAGIGVGTLSQRKGADAVKLLPSFLAHLADLGLVERDPVSDGRVLGGWLKMGMVGTVPARGNTLLVGDAAGLVNALQGEGISQSLTSGRAAGLAVLAGASLAPSAYIRQLARDHVRYNRVTASVQAALVTRPRAISVVGRILTAPAVANAIAPGWGLYWNELLDGSSPGIARTTAWLAQVAGDALTRRSPPRRWFDSVFGDAVFDGVSAREGAQEPGGPDQLAGGSLAGKDSSPHSSTSSGSELSASSSSLL